MTLLQFAIFQSAPITMEEYRRKGQSEKERLLNDMLMTNEWHINTPVSAQREHYQKLIPRIKNCLAKNNVSNEISEVVMGLLNDEIEMRLTATSANKLLRGSTLVVDESLVGTLLKEFSKLEMPIVSDDKSQLRSLSKK